MHYSGSTFGFYDEEMKDSYGDRWPEDAVYIEDDYYKSLLEGQSSGKVITPNETGYPILIEQEIIEYIPQVLSRFQALTILKINKVPNSEITLYKATDEYINSLPEDVIKNIATKTAWENAQEFRRDSLLIQMAQAKFGLTEKQVDEMFIQGAKLVA